MWFLKKRRFPASLVGNLFVYMETNDSAGRFFAQLRRSDYIIDRTSFDLESWDKQAMGHPRPFNGKTV